MLGDLLSELRGSGNEIDQKFSELQNDLDLPGFDFDTNFGSFGRARTSSTCHQPDSPKSLSDSSESGVPKKRKSAGYLTALLLWSDHILVSRLSSNPGRRLPSRGTQVTNVRHSSSSTCLSLLAGSEDDKKNKSKKPDKPLPVKPVKPKKKGTQFELDYADPGKLPLSSTS